jgi:lysophospholipid acyltransferase (LPLAT)-like uncharacterized protein
LKKFSLLGFLLGVIARVLQLTYRFKFHDNKTLEVLRGSLPRRQYLAAIWHNNLLGAILSGNKITHATIISRSRDGELLAWAARILNLIPARGSSHRGGILARADLNRLLDQGYPGAITVDGPTGPIYGVKRGIIEMAKNKNLPIVPYVCYPEKYWLLKKSWDQFRIPKPFSRIFLKVCDPIWVPSDLLKEDYAKIQEKIKLELLQGEDELKELIL